MSSVVVGNRQSGQIAGGTSSPFFRRSALQTGQGGEIADDKSKMGGQDQARVASSDHYEIRDFAYEFGISLGQVHDLIRRHGNDRATLEREARKLSQ